MNENLLKIPAKCNIPLEKVKNCKQVSCKKYPNFNLKKRKKDRCRKKTYNAWKLKNVSGKRERPLKILPEKGFAVPLPSLPSMALQNKNKHAITLVL